MSGYLFKKRLSDKVDLRLCEVSSLVACVIFFKGGLFTRKRYYKHYNGDENQVTSLRNIFVSLIDKGYIELVKEAKYITKFQRLSGWYRVSEKGVSFVNDFQLLLKKDASKLASVNYSFIHNKRGSKSGNGDSPLLDY